MAHNSANLTPAHPEGVEALWEAICEEAAKVMDVMSWFLFSVTPWAETGGKSLQDLADEGDTAGMQTILDSLRVDVEAYEADPDNAEDGHLHPSVDVGIDGASDKTLITASAEVDDEVIDDDDLARA